MTLNRFGQVKVEINITNGINDVPNHFSNANRKWIVVINISMSLSDFIDN